MNDRTGRRARLVLLAAGLLASLALGAVGGAVALLAAVRVPMAVTALVALPVVAALVAGWSARARRSSTTVLVGAAMVAAVGFAVLLGLLAFVLVLGRLPAGGARRVVGAHEDAVRARIGHQLHALLRIGRHAGRRRRAAILPGEAEGAGGEPCGTRPGDARRL